MASEAFVTICSHLVGICKPAHTTHDAKYIVIGSICFQHNSCVVLVKHIIGQSQSKSAGIYTREIARAAGLMLFGSDGETIQINSSIGLMSVVLERLDGGKPIPASLRKPLSPVKCQTCCDNWILSPTMQPPCRFA